MVREILIFAAFFVLIGCLMHPVAAASDQNFSNEDYATSIAQKCSDGVIVHIADGIGSVWKNNTFSQSYNESSDVTEEYGATRGAITALVTAKAHPDQIDTIKKWDENSKNEWAFLVCIFIFTFLIVNKVKRTKELAFSKVLSDYDLSSNRFVFGVLACIGSYAAPRAVLLLDDICSVISKYAMVEIMDFIEPSTQNAIMYLCMMIGELLVAVPFIIRLWVIDTVYAASRFLVVLYIIGICQDQIVWIWIKFKRILEIQPVCVFAACIMLAAIKAEHMETNPASYVILFFVIAYIIKEWMVPGVVTRTVKRGTGIVVGQYRTWRA